MKKGSFVDAGSPEFAKDHEAETEGGMQNNESNEGEKRSSKEIEGTDLNFEETFKDTTTEVMVSYWGFKMQMMVFQR